MKRILMLMFCCCILCSCGSDKNEEVEKAVVNNVSCSQMKELVSDGAVLIDVRTLAEYRSGSLEGAINISHDVISTEIVNEVTNKNTKIVVYCKSGNRSATAAQTLVDIGYKNVYDMGGINNCEK